MILNKKELLSFIESLEIEAFEIEMVFNKDKYTELPSDVRIGTCTPVAVPCNQVEMKQEIEFNCKSLF